MNRLLTLATLLLAASLAGCAGAPPVSLEGADTTLTPSIASEGFETVRGRRVVWGGIVVATTNHADHTVIEVLGYPLDKRTRPLTEARAQGRFLVRREGYLETVDYAPGRAVTAGGLLSGVEEGKVGEASYRYPVLSADALHLWKPLNARASGVRFGFGIVITN